MDFNNLVDNLDGILKESSNLYGFSTLALIIIGLLCVVLYARSSEKHKNRAFIITILFFMGLTLATLTAGIVGGFQQGNEVGIEQGSEKVQEQIQQDPSIVNISSDAAQTLDELITADGLQVDSESKTLIVEKAIRTLNDSLEAESIEKPSWVEEKEGFLFKFQGCSRKTGSTNVFCNFLITNQESEERVLTMYGGNSTEKSTIVAQGEVYGTRDFSVGNQPDIGSNRSTSTMPSRAEIGAWAEFKNVPESVDVLQSALFVFKTKRGNNLDTIKLPYMDIPISST